MVVQSAAEAITYPAVGAELDIEGVSHAFDIDGVALPVLDNVTLSIAPGEFVALLGPSGSGKSTVLNMIASLIRPTGGEILIDGKRVVAGKATPNVGYVFQRDTLFPWRTVGDNIGYGLELSGVPASERKERIAECVAQAGLKGFENAYPSALSGGMRQRAALMRTLIVEPQILLMDEPFGALDAQTREVMQDLVLSVVAQEGTTILFVTHDVEEALYLGSRVVLMSPHPGRIDTIYDVPLPKTRNVMMRVDPRFLTLKRQVMERVRETVGLSLDRSALGSTGAEASARPNS